MFSLLSPTTCIKPGYRLLSNQTFAYNFPDYQPRPPWFGADLQTLYNKIAQPQTNLSQYLNSRLLLPLNDDSGDALVGRLFLPDTPTTTAFTRPLIVLVHGLGGSAQSIYMRVAAEHFLTNNYPVLKVNLRGVAESGPYCGEHNHPGCSDDLHLLLEGLITQVKPNLLVQGVVLMGFSLGGNIVLKFLGEQPKHPLVWAGITVSAPLDLAATSEALLEWRNAGYQRYLLRRIWANSLRPTMEISPLEREALANANSVWEVDAMFTAPWLGFATVEQYYDAFSSKHFLGDINVPTLIIHALDDPFVPHATHFDYNWDSNPLLVPLMVECGGHNGFYGRDSLVPWHNRCAIEFLKNLEKQSNSRSLAISPVRQNS